MAFLRFGTKLPATWSRASLDELPQLVLDRRLALVREPDGLIQ